MIKWNFHEAIASFNRVHSKKRSHLPKNIVLRCTLSLGSSLKITARLMTGLLLWIEWKQVKYCTTYSKKQAAPPVDRMHVSESPAHGVLPNPLQAQVEKKKRVDRFVVCLILHRHIAWFRPVSHFMIISFQYDTSTCNASSYWWSW